MQQHLLLLWLLHCLYIWHQCSAATDVRGEVAKLRAELNAALEADEAQQPNPGGVIVQPTWTKDSTKVAPSQLASKVVANKAALSETAKLRDEINRAVSNDAYAAGIVGNAQQLHKLEAMLQQQTPHVADTRDEHLGSQPEEQTAGTQPFVVDSMASSYDTGIDLAELQHLELSKRRTREMLMLTRIVEDVSFTLGADVEQWLHLQHNGSSLLVGRRREDLLLLQQQATGYNPKQMIQIHAAIDIVLALEHWNALAQLQEGIILVAVQTQLHWYRANNATREFALAWHWQLGGNPISHLTTFSLDGLDYLVLASSQTVSVYAYNLEAQEFWIAQRIQLTQACSAVAVLDTGRDLLLAVGQRDQTHVYSYNARELPPDAGLHLQLRHSLATPQLAHIAAFQMGGCSYLALGGQQPQILQYAQGQLLPHTMLGQNFGLVELFLPVPVRTYRDDLLLLVQHRVQLDTHALVVLEALVWNGEAFEVTVPAPCKLGGQTLHEPGVACMLDVQREAGLQGAALFRQADMPVLLVPRQQVPSGLFQLHTELLPRNSELHDLQDIYDFMRDWLQEQDELVQRAERLLTQHVYEQIATPMLINEGATLQAIYVNDVLWTDADTHTDMHLLIHELRLLEQSLHGERGKRQLQLFHFDYDQLDLDEVEALELTIDQLNHVPYYVQQATLQFNGTLNVQQLEVLPAPVPVPVPPATNATNTTAVPLLQLTGELACDYINGIAWSNFVQDLVWRQQPLKLPQLRVNGSVVFEQALQLHTLNELRFPADFLWSYANSTSIIEAPKNFTQLLSVNSMDMMGTINGMNPADAITLSDEQSWPNTVTFTQLEVSEALQLNGRAQLREQLQPAPVNPTLLETRFIDATCHFEQLHINGTLRLRGQLDNDSFEALIGDLAQRTANSSEALLIPAAKRFANLSLPVDTQLFDGAINGIAITDFVPKHTSQTLRNLSSLAGYVYFKKLQLTGSYDGVNLTALLQQAVRLDEPLQAPSTWLNFVQGGQLLCEPPAAVLVTERLNGVQLATGYQLLQEPLYLRAAHFAHLSADVLEASQQLTGNASLNGRQLDAYSQTGDIYVQDLTLPQGVQVAELQRWNAALLLSWLQQLDELPLLILAGVLDVDSMFVQGNVQLSDALNGEQFTQLQRQVVWLDRANVLSARWSFEQAPQFAGALQVLGSFNDRHLPPLLADIVFRGSEVYIAAPKRFLQPLRVLGEAHVAALNGVPFERLANKQQPIALAGSLQLNGRLHVEQLQLAGTLNEQSLQPLQAQLRYNAAKGVYVQRGLIRMPAQTQLADLYVQGQFGNDSADPLEQFLQSVLYKRQPLLQLQGHKTFAGRVSIRQSAHIEQLNELPLAELMQQLIYVDGDEPVTVHTRVHFEAPVELFGELHVNGQLRLQQGLLNGCNVSAWLSESVRVDRPWQVAHRLVFAPGALAHNELQLRYVNDVDMRRLVTLHSAQNLSAPLVCQELHLAGELEVQGLVNSVNLSEAYANTLLLHAPHPQVVKTPLIMQTLHVSGPLDVLSPVNGNPSLNLSDVATLHSPELQLQTPLYFAALHTPKLQTAHTLAGINFTYWHQHSLWARARPLQNISGKWSVSNLRVLQTPSHRLQRRQASSSNSLQQLCASFRRSLDALRLPYQLKQLSPRFRLQLAANQSDIRRVFVLQLQANGSSYLLLDDRNCWTHIYRWNGARYAAASSGSMDYVPAVQLHESSQQSYYLGSNDSSAQRNCDEHSARHGKSLPWRQLRLQPTSPPPPPAADYPRTLKYLKPPKQHTENHSDYSALLPPLSGRLQAEVNITQLSIPESDLYDAQLIEQFLQLMRTLEQQQLYPPQSFASVGLATLPLPDNPARVLAARSVQIIWPVIVQLEGMSAPPALKQSLGLAVRDVLLLGNNDTTVTHYTPQLHAVIARLRALQTELQSYSTLVASSLPANQLQLSPQATCVETLRLQVGPANRARLLYARLHVVLPAVPPAAAHIQIHEQNGSLFQSLAAAHTTRQLITLRIRDETLLGFVEQCCRVRIFIYRGIEGFVPFAQFDADFHIVQLLALRLPLPRPPGVMYTLGVAQARQIVFYELVVAGLLEPWLQCK